MRVFAQSSWQFLLGLLAKSRLILMFMVAMVVVLIWADHHTRGMWG